MDQWPNEFFCILCLEDYDSQWHGRTPFRVECDHTPACQPFPASIEGTRLEYLALVTTLDPEFTLWTMHPESWNEKLIEVVHTLNTEFVKAVRAHEGHFLNDHAGLDVFLTTHQPLDAPQTPDPTKDRLPGALYAKATTKARLQRGDHGWYIWNAAVKQFNRSMMRLIEEYDEQEYPHGAETGLQEWVRKFPLPLDN